ncbi:MAG: helix-turn-helix domain-containing protein [Bacteroidetes bacterium]|nr:helix-turn-helix domain-containing protein [Bacteroidota bacterium]
MNKTNSIEDLSRRLVKFKKNISPLIFHNKKANELGHFNVYSRANFCTRLTPYNRRDYYKISLIIGTGVLNYADKVIEINKNALVFSNPIIPYSWEAISEKQEGYFCLFTGDFINSNDKASKLKDSPLFKIGGDPVFFLNDEQTQYLSEIYIKMLDEMKSDYIYKYDVMKNYLHILIHQALKLKPADSYYNHSNASSRITSLFIELLERQFPIDSIENSLRFKTAKDFANSMSIHVNHLNRAVKETTGKSTTQHIAERIVKEAKALLVHSDWNISEIAYSLGFEYPTYFNNFFKKHTNLSPKSLRH